MKLAFSNFQEIFLRLENEVSVKIAWLEVWSETFSIFSRMGNAFSKDEEESQASTSSPSSSRKRKRPHAGERQKTPVVKKKLKTSEYCRILKKKHFLFAKKFGFLVFSFAHV